MAETTSLQLFDALPKHIDDALRASIERFGVLVPVAKDQHGRTLDGHHRARIADELGIKYRVDVINVASEAEAQEIQRTLNADRRQLTEEQRRAVAVALRQAGHSERAIAGALGVSQPTIHRDLEASTDSCESVEPQRIVGLDGKSRPARRPTIVAAKDGRDAERAQQALATLTPELLPPVMGVRDVQRAVAQQQREELKAHPVEVPNGTYRCVVIDPPWPMGKSARDARPDQGPVLDYPTLPVWCEQPEIHREDRDQWRLTCWKYFDSLGVDEPFRCCQSIECRVGHVLDQTAAEGSCHVYMWVTHRFLPEGIRLFDEWGVQYHCVLTWVKNVGFTPYSWMFDTEHVLFGYIGSLELQQQGLRLAFSAPAVGHSVKPDVFYDRVRAASREPRLEMFARRSHEGFEPWGDEVADEK